MSLQETSVIIIAAAGIFFMLTSGIGLLRMPDIFSRMHAAGNATTIGISLLLVSTGIHFWDQDQFLRMLLLIVLIFGTAPIATSAMARAAYRTTSARALHLEYDDLGNKHLIPHRSVRAQPEAKSSSTPTDH